MNQIFLTGVTGFLGKVVLTELLRRKEELSIQKIYALVRPNKKGHSARKRFATEVVASPCFSKLSKNWTDLVEIIEGELTQDHLNLSQEVWKTLTTQITHVIHCAASVKFDLPLKEAAGANITTGLKVLSFARECPKLEKMVSVSTAYVTPHQKNGGKVEEKLFHLFKPAANIYQDILEGKASTKQLLQKTKLPNTYTVTKCIAEHLLLENKGNVPLTIVRPSIIAACLEHPLPGWIDSAKAFAGYVIAIGLGYLRSVDVNTKSYLDLVPCDEVATRIIKCAFKPSGTIIHAVAGLNKSCRIDLCIEGITRFFSNHKLKRTPGIKYAGPRTIRFHLKDWQHHRIPYGLLARRLLGKLNYLNKAFPYFTHSTFDFESSQPIEHPLFEPKNYIQTVCRGTYRYLLKRDDSEVLLDTKRRAFKKSDANLSMRIAASLFRKIQKRCADQITFDRASFEEALSQTPKDHLLVIVPTHRSYMDFVLCSYLFFCHPEMGIAIPHIAAAEEFSRILILGKLFKKGKAFFIKRGLRQANPELTQKIKELVEKRETLEFFIEGTRSRSRKLLKPKRGLLKALQSTGQKFAILPVAISYDRIPEEEAFVRELKGNPKPKMQLRYLTFWLWDTLCGKTALGRIHIACGNPILLNPQTDVYKVSQQTIAQLQKVLITTTHHLNCFLKKNPHLGIDLTWLKQAIVDRGGKVLESTLEVEELLDPVVEQTMRYHWTYFFYQDALKIYPEDPAILCHIKENDYGAKLERRQDIDPNDPKLFTLVECLFEPIRRDYAIVAHCLKMFKDPKTLPTPRELVQLFPLSHLPNLEEAYEQTTHSHHRGDRIPWATSAQETGN